MHRNHNKQGVILIMVISFLTVLLMLAGTVHLVLTVNTRQAAYMRSATAAFAQADSGADYVASRLRADEVSGSVTLSVAHVSVNYAAPSGYNFDTVTNLTRLPNGRAYLYRVTGRNREARAIIDVVVGRTPPNMMGLFGNQSVSMGPTTRVLSYRSSITTTPTSSTGEALAGSNQLMGGTVNAVDGTVVLGESTTATPASFPFELTTSATVVRTARIDPDPLGIAGGVLSNEFDYVAVSNSNSTAVGGTITAGTLNISGDVTLRAGSYYVSQIDMANHRTLTIDATAGPVKIYLLGPVSSQSNSHLIVNPAKAENFLIYAKGTSAIHFQPNASFVGFIYAPYASIQIQPGANFYGGVWGNSVSVQPNGNIYVDVDFIENFNGGQTMKRLSWKQVVE